jgi:hypothetical protein
MKRWQSESLRRCKFDMGYVIGLLEGEAWFQATLHNHGGDYRFGIAVAMTDKEPLLKLRSVVGGTIFGPYRNKLSTKDYWQWKLARKEKAVNFTQRIQPHMSPRRQKQIQKVLDLAKQFPPQGKGYL